MDMATFQIIGRIGKKQRFGKTLKVNIASKWYDRNAKAEKANWNTVTFIGKDADRVEEHLPEGTQLIVKGRIANSSYEKDGETIYTTDLTVTEFDALSFPKKQDDGSDVVE